MSDLIWDDDAGAIADHGGDEISTHLCNNTGIGYDRLD